MDERTDDTAADGQVHYDAADYGGVLLSGGNRTRNAGAVYCDFHDGGRVLFWYTKGEGIKHKRGALLRPAILHNSCGNIHIIYKFILLQKNKTARKPYSKRFLTGAPLGGRTLDTLIKSQVLYQLS